MLFCDLILNFILGFAVDQDNVVIWVDKHISSSSSNVWMPYFLYWFDLIRAGVHDVAVTPVESGEAKYGDGNSNSAWKLMLEMLEYSESGKG